MKTLIFASLTLMMLTSFSFKPTTQHILLVLKNPMDVESFSMFNIKRVNGILIGTNTDEYPVKDGLYRIEGSSNDKFYHKNIMITSN